MRSRERVAAALELRSPDHAPLGELVITDGFVRTFLGPGGSGSGSVAAAERAKVIHALGLDLVCLPFSRAERPGHPEAAFFVSETAFFVSETDLFVFALIDGAFGRSVSRLGLGELLALLGRDLPAARRVLAEAGEWGRNALEAAARQGAHGVVVADDLACNRGLFLRPALLREILAPTWRRLAEQAVDLGLKAVFHSDGYILDIIPDLIEAGFAGVHSLQAVGGQDLGQIKKRFGRSACLWGNLDLGLLASGTPAEVKRVVAETMQTAAPGGGYIFGTSGGLVDGLPPANVVAAYRAARAWRPPG
jgi:uroporphyrinogen decarboxylase